MAGQSVPICGNAEHHTTLQARATPQKDSGRHASRWHGRCANRGPKSPCDDRAATKYGRTWDNAISRARAHIDSSLREKLPNRRTEVGKKEFTRESISTTIDELSESRKRKLSLFDIRDWVSLAFASYMCI